MEMLDIAKEKLVFYIPGAAFMVDTDVSYSMRLSFCLPPVDVIPEGIRRLEEVMREYKKSKGL